MILSRALATLVCTTVLSAIGLHAAEWVGSDLGKPGATGSFTSAGEKITLRGGGAGPFFLNKAWAGHFAHQTVTGNFQFTARLAQGVVPGAKIGLMVRDALDPLSTFRFIFFDQETGGVRGLKRYPDGMINWGYQPVKMTAQDVWLRLERSGDMVVARCSSNGMDWSLVSPGSMNGPGLPDWVMSAKTLEVGLAVMGEGNDASLATATFDQVQLNRAPQSLVTASWMGNSEGANPHWVQNHIAGIAVAPDGTVYAAAEWDEGAREMGIYKDGKVVGQLEGNFHDGKAHGAISCDGGFVVIGGEFEGHGVGLRRYDLSGKEVGWGSERFLQFPGITKIGAVAVRGNLIAISAIDHFKPETGDNAVTVFDVAQRPVAVLGTWKIPRLGRIALGSDGDVWAVQGGALSDGKRRVVGDAGGNKLDCFVGRGLKDAALATPGAVVHMRIGQEKPIATFVIENGDPTALALTPDGKRLWVADNGPAQRVRIFDITGTTIKAAGFYGDEGGVYGGKRPGALGEGKLPSQINGLGFDAQGNAYLAGDGWAWCGADIRSSTPDGKRRWQLLGLHGVVDMGGFDPASDKDVFSGSEHFTMDWSKPAGQQWTYAGYTLDPFAFPEDMRLSYAHESTMVRQVKGQRLLAVSNMYSDWLAIYRFDEKHGEIAIPCAWFNARGGWVAGAPKDPWLWTDTNGDGRRQADEFTTFPNNYPGAGPGLDLDSNGDLWCAGMTVQHLPFAGFNSHGGPTWKAPVITPRPAAFPDTEGGHDMRRIVSVPEKDQVWIGGWGVGRRNPWSFFATVASTLVRYDNWSKGGTPAVHIDLPVDFLTGEQVVKSMAVAGDYVFTADLYDARLVIYDARTGALVKSLTPGPELSGRTGWVDIAFGIDAIKRANGDYAVLVEDDGFCKMNLYTWNPTKEPKLAAPKVRVEGQRLAWEVNEAVGSWQVQEVGADGKPGAVVAKNLRGTTFADNTLLTGSRSYRVTAVNGAGESAPSAIVTLTAKAAGAKLAGTPIGTDAQATAEAAKAIDGDKATVASVPGKGAWIGLDLGEGGAVLSQVRVLPREKNGVLLQNSSIQGSNDDPKLNRWTVLTTITPIANEAGWTPFAIADQRPWRYVRMVTAVGNDVNLAEWEVLGAK